MAEAKRNPDPEETFLNYFEMQRPPFGPPADPLEIFDCEQYSFLTDQLVSASEQAGSLAVICGVDGSGKTTLLNRYISNLPESTTYVRFDETCKTGKQFYSDFLKQLGFEEIGGTLREFRNITREFLIYHGTAGKPVLVLVDNAHLVKPSVLEQLRWISATKIKSERVLSVVLAGNSDLPRIMESPAMRSLKFGHRMDFNVRVYTESETDAYVWHCLNASGGAHVAKFSNEARAMIYRYTGGIPGQINALCNAALTEACAQKNRVIDDKLVRAVADREEMLPHAVPLKNKGRRKTDEDLVSSADEELVSNTDEDLVSNIEAELAKLDELAEPAAPAEKESGAKTATSKKAGTKRKAKATKLTTDVKKEGRAAITANADLRKAKALIEKQEKQVKELQASVSELTADLNSAKGEVVESDEPQSESQSLESLEAKLADRDSRVAELEATLATYASDNTTAEEHLRVSHDAVLGIEVLRDGNSEQTLNIGKGQTRIMIGRADDCELQLGGNFVSRHHALLHLSDDGAFIEDLKSFNGTIVNGSKISRRKVSPGDKINIGDYVLRARPA